MLIYLELKINVMHSNNTQSQWGNTIFTAVAPVIWGSTYIVATEFLPSDSPFTTALLRTLPAGILLALLSKRLPQQGEWGRLIVLAALNISFFQAFLFVAAYRLPGGVAAVVGAIQPLLVMGLAWALDRRRPVSVAVFASVVGIIGMGVLLLAPTSKGDPMGVIAALTGAACMASGTYLTRRWKPELPLMAFTGWQLLAGGLMLLPVAWLLDPPLPALGVRQVIGYVYLSIAGALLAYALWFRGIARLSPVAVSSLGLLSPLTAVILGWIFLGQSMTGLSLIGLLLVLGSILVVQWSMSRQA